jgi:hypothetical protein
MTLLEVAYRYGAPLRQSTMRALDDVREVYGVRRISFDSQAQIVRLEFDASRFKEPVIASLLRDAGLDLKERLILTAPSGATEPTG